MLLLQNKLPYSQNLKATHLYYLIASVDQEGNYELAESFTHIYRADIKVLAWGFNSCLRFVVLIQAHWLLAGFLSANRGHTLPCHMTLVGSSQLGYFLPRPIWPMQDYLTFG